MVRIARKGWSSGTTSSRVVMTMNPACLCSSPRKASSLFVICRDYSIREGQSEVAQWGLRTTAGRVSRRLFQQPASADLEPKRVTMTDARVVIVVENQAVPRDRRVWREALALRDAGYDVHVISPALGDYRVAHEVLD